MASPEDLNRAAPRATYRVQLHAGFDFDAAAGLADYLAALGVSHLYVSPCLQATPGSTHGYDVVDPGAVNEELGGEAGRARLVTALARHGLGQVLDVVPNHMAVRLPENRWFWHVLEHGPASRYAGHFDVDWDHPPGAKRRHQVLLPVLGDHYGRVLEAGEIRLDHDAGRFTVSCPGHVLPVNPASLAGLVEGAALACGSDDLAFLAASLRRLPPATATDARDRFERHRDAGVLHRQLRRLCREAPAVLEAVDGEVARLNRDPDALDAFLDAQNYRLAFWRASGEEVDYRRFFDIDTLIGLRVEDPQVFADTHERILGWVRDGSVDGLRIDHPDGLRLPGDYLARLRDAAPTAWIVVEKILEPGEPLRRDWPVDGTTGYDFLNDVGALFVDPDGEAPFTRLYGELTGADTDWPAVLEDAKRQVLRDVLAADLHRLVRWFLSVCEARRRYRDFTRRDLAEALAETLVHFGVYRTYVGEAGKADPEDRRRIAGAVSAARDARPDLDAELFAFLERILSGDLSGPAEAELRLRFQQLSGPVMAKGAEDTAFYRYVRLASLCEVGGAPDRFGAGPAAFHARCARAQAAWPRAMLALSTHDTKRSADVRARLVLLSEILRAWEETVRRWMDRNRVHRAGPELPDRAAEYLLYQTLVGAWPLSAERAWTYMEKAAREARLHTSWTSPDPGYDAALESFVRGVCGDADFARELEAFVAPLVGPGRVNALAWQLLQTTAPGVPDLYQGSELWDLSLVDPDNRRPVDWAARRRALAALEAGPDVAAVSARADEGLPKLHVIRAALRLRARRPEAFGPGPAGAYRPLEAEGPAAHHAVAFARGDAAVTVVPRLVHGLAARGGWADTTLPLPDGDWVDVLTGARHAGGALRLAEALERFPVALLARPEDAA